MGKMTSSRVDSYNELIIEYGWIVLFAPAFPIAGLFSLFSNLIQFKAERDGIRMFHMRCEPRSVLDIGRWLEYFELMSTVGIINSVGLVIFTSEKLSYFDNDGSVTWASLVVTVFIIENVLMMFRVLLAAAIPDNPEWIEKEIFANENRVKQVEAEVGNKKIE
jgi:hypothetical protein